MASMASVPALYPLVLPQEHSGFPTRVQTSPLFPWISQAKLGSLTKNFPWKQLTTRTKHKQGHTKPCTVSSSKMTGFSPRMALHAAFQGHRHLLLFLNLGGEPHPKAPLVGC